MRDRATLTMGLCTATLIAAAAVSAHAQEPAPFAALGEGAERAGEGAAHVARDAVGAAEWAARAVQEPIEDAAWAATVTLTPELRTPPREVRVPKPVLAARPDLSGAPQSGGKQHALSGIASFYWQDQMTASGERFNKNDLTAAHRSLPFGTKVRVSCARTGKDVVVRINDRGPFKPGRVIDLSQAAAEKIGMTGRGLTTVQLEVVKN